MIGWCLAAWAAPPEVDLDQALAAAAADHPEVEAARWSTRAAAARHTGRTLDPLPRIELAAGVQWWTEPVEVQLVEGDDLTLPTTITQGPFGPTLAPLFDALEGFGEPIVLREQRTSQLAARAALPLTGQLPLAHARSAAAHQLDAAEADERSTRARVGVDVVEAYTAALAAEELVEVGDAVVANLRSALDRALAFEAAGMVQRADRLQLQVALSEAELEAGAARSRRDLAQQRLALVMGSDAEAVRPRPLGDAPLPPPPALDADVAGADTRFVFADPERLRALATDEALEAAFLMWAPEEHGFHCVDASRATRAGLRSRPTVDTIRDTLAWARDRPEPPERHGLDVDRERELLSSLSGA